MNWIIARIIDIYIGIPLLYILRIFSGPSRPVSVPSPSRVLLIKFWGAGNIMMLLPGLAAVKKVYPEIKADFLTLTSNRDILKSTNLCDDGFFIDTSGLFQLVRTTLTALRRIRLSNYDVAIDFEQFARFSAFIMAFTRAKRKVGLSTARQHRHFFYNLPVVYRDDIHTADTFISLFKTAFDRDFSPDHTPERYFSIDRPAVRKILDSCGFGPERMPAIFHIGTSPNFNERRWPPEYFARLADKLIDAYNIDVVLTGIARENDIARSVLGAARRTDHICDLTGKLNFNDFVSLIASAGFLVSVDTAPVHIASLLSVPVAGLYGPNTPVLYGPWGSGPSLAFYKQLPCSPCITNYNAKINWCRNPRGKGVCMRDITVEEVFEGIAARFFPVPRKDDK